MAGHILGCFRSGAFAIIACPADLFVAIDLPFSFVADTIILPYTIPKSASNKRLKEDIEKQMILVKDFVGNNKEVIKVAGEIKSLSANQFMSNQLKIIPDRYDVTVEGSSGNNIYAIVRVSNSPNGANFSLDCISRLSWNYRDLSKDVCEK